MGLAFFGLTFEIAPQVRAALFKQIHEICFHGKGGYDWKTVYDMPIWLRKFTFNEIQKFYEEEQEQIENQSGNSNNKTLVDPSGKVNVPEFVQNSKPYKKPAKYK